MTPVPPAIVAIALAIAPAPALAQTWAASGAAGAPAMDARQDGVSIATARVAAWSQERQRFAERRRIVLTTRAEAGDLQKTPEVEVRPRTEWLSDEGLRISPTRVAYKERF